jgi:CBS domain-containing protein
LFGRPFEINFQPFQFKNTLLKKKKIPPMKLQSVSISEILTSLNKRNEELIQAPSTCTVEQLLQLMKKHNILSVPIIETSKKIYLGIVDVIDIMRFTVLEFYGENIMRDDFFTQFDYEKGTAGLLCKGQRCQKMLVLEENDSLLHLMQTLNYSEQRVLVLTRVTNECYLYRILTQMDIIKFLHKSKDKLGEILQQKVAGMGVNGKSLKVITENDKAVVGFQMIYENHIHSVGVVDQQGKLITNLSSSDVRGISTEQLQKVKLPVLQFLNEVIGAVRPAITCKNEDSLEKVIDIIVKDHIHRVWVTDEKNVPIGVITLTDIITYIVQHQKEAPQISTTQ